MYIRIKNIKQRSGKRYPYAYLCECKWINGKVKQKVIKYLGRVDIGIIDLTKIKFDECAKCHTKENLTIDHIIPLTKGGLNEMKNIQILCKKCNDKKGAKDETN